MEKALVIGKGFLGRYIAKELEKSGILTTTTGFNNFRKNDIRVDVRNINSLNECISKFDPEYIINCASNNDIDFLENNPELAFKTNAEGAKNVSISCEKNGIRLIHISTDSVFDGRKGMYSEEDTPHPINVYGKSKFLAEKFVKQNSSNYVIVRTNFYGFNTVGKYFFNWVLDTLKRNDKEITGFSDIIFNPLEISNLSRMIVELSQKNFRGIIHLSSDEILSKYQFILKVAEVFKLNKDLIKKGLAENFEFVAKRPKNTSLYNGKANSLLKTPNITIMEGLEKIKTFISDNVYQ